MRIVQLKELIQLSGSVSDCDQQEGNSGQQQEPRRQARKVMPNQITKPSEERPEGRTSKVVRDRVSEWAEQSAQEMHAQAATLENQHDRNYYLHREDIKKNHAGLKSARRYEHGGENTINQSIDQFI